MRITDGQKSIRLAGTVCGAVVRRTIAALSIAAGMAVVASCAVPLFGPAPVQYESVTTVVGDRGALHSVAGLYYTIANTTDREIIRLEIGFSLFDANGAPMPVFGANSFIAGVACRLAAGETISLCTNLDRHVPPTAVSLEFSRFRVISATFTDGSIWRNPGSYIYAGGHE